jgi:hypothetical protein
VKYKEHLPDSSLQDYVKCFWILEREYTLEDPNEEVTPDASVELIFNFGAPYVLQVENQPDREMPMAFLVGLQNKPLLFRSEGTVKIVATRFYAWGISPFLDTKAQTPNSPTIKLGREWRDLANRIEPKVRADNYDGAVATVEDFLIGKLLTAAFEPRQIQIAAQLLHREKGQF